MAVQSEPGVKISGPTTRSTTAATRASSTDNAPPAGSHTVTLSSSSTPAVGNTSVERSVAASLTLRLTLPAGGSWCALSGYNQSRDVMGRADRVGPITAAAETGTARGGSIVPTTNAASKRVGALAIWAGRPTGLAQRGT